MRPPPPTATRTVSSAGRPSRRGLPPIRARRFRAGDGRLRIVRVDLERAAFRDEGVAALLRLGVARAADDRVRPAGADARHFRGRRDLRHEHRRGNAELLRRVGDRRAVVAARSGGAAGGRRRPGQEIVERATRLERAGMLQGFELQRHTRGAGKGIRRQGRGISPPSGEGVSRSGVRRTCAAMRRCAARMASGVTGGGEEESIGIGSRFPSRPPGRRFRSQKERFSPGYAAERPASRRRRRLCEFGRGACSAREAGARRRLDEREYPLLCFLRQSVSAAERSRYKRQFKACSALRQNGHRHLAEASRRHAGLREECADETRRLGIARAQRHFSDGLACGRQQLERPPQTERSDELAVANALLPKRVLQRPARQPYVVGNRADSAGLVAKIERSERRLGHRSWQWTVGIPRPLDCGVRRQTRCRRPLAKPLRGEDQFVVVRTRPDPDADAILQDARFGRVRLRGMDFDCGVPRFWRATHRSQHLHQRALGVVFDRRLGVGPVANPPVGLVANDAQILDRSLLWSVLRLDAAGDDLPQRLAVQRIFDERPELLQADGPPEPCPELGVAATASPRNCRPGSSGRTAPGWRGHSAAAGKARLPAQAAQRVGAMFGRDDREQGTEARCATEERRRHRYAEDPKIVIAACELAHAWSRPRRTGTAHQNRLSHSEHCAKC